MRDQQVMHLMVVTNLNASWIAHWKVRIESEDSTLDPFPNLRNVIEASDIYNLLSSSRHFPTWPGEINDNYTIVKTNENQPDANTSGTTIVTIPSSMLNRVWIDLQWRSSEPIALWKGNESTQYRALCSVLHDRATYSCKQEDSMTMAVRWSDIMQSVNFPYRWLFDQGLFVPDATIQVFTYWL